MLDNFHVENFRALKNLTIEKTARINLIVGSNNVGKTSLLEAIHFLLGGSDESYNLQNAFRFGINHTDFWNSVNKNHENILVSGSFNEQEHSRSMTDGGRGWIHSTIVAKSLSISIAPFESNKLLKFYQSAYDSGVKPKLISLLKSIDSSIKSLEQAKLSGEVWTIKFETDNPFPIDISSMGQGFIRAVGLYCQLLACERDIALIDEVEIGMHHDSLPALWEALRDSSDKANIQIFATTHSYECIKAAVETFKNAPEMFQLIRLVKNEEGVKALCFTAEEIDAALSYNAEVR
jgi:AAA15 family ATPase/GTPase